MVIFVPFLIQTEYNLFLYQLYYRQFEYVL